MKRPRWRPKSNIVTTLCQWSSRTTGIISPIGYRGKQGILNDAASRSSVAFALIRPDYVVGCPRCLDLYLGAIAGDMMALLPGRSPIQGGDG